MKFFIVLLLMLLANVQALSQDTTGTVVTLCDKIGPSIDQEERNTYKLFPFIQDFTSAMLLQRQDGSCIFKVISKKADDPMIKVRWISTDAEELQRIRDLIEPKTTIQGIDTTQTRELSKLSSTRVKHKSGKILGEFLAGGTLGACGAIVFGGIGAIVNAPGGREYSALQGAATGGSIGWIIGSTVGICLVGNSHDEKGSYLATLLGSVLAVGIWGVLFHDPDDATFVGGCLVTPIIGGIIGFNASSKYVAQPAKEGALINYKDGHFALSLPQCNYRLSRADKRSLVRYIDLVRVQF